MDTRGIATKGSFTKYAKELLSLTGDPSDMWSARTQALYNMAKVLEKLKGGPEISIEYGNDRVAEKLSRIPIDDLSEWDRKYLSDGIQALRDLKRVPTVTLGEMS